MPNFNGQRFEIAEISEFKPFKAGSSLLKKKMFGKGRAVRSDPILCRH
jgi:hypothetical protein